MKNKQFELMYQEYQKGFSLAQVGKMFGVTRQSVYAGFKCREYRLRKKKELPYQFFNGDKFTLRDTGYYGRSLGDRKLMHRVVWEYHNGKIPKGYDVHHKDRDRTNNRIENLGVMSKSEHSRRFSTGTNQYTKSKQLNRGNKE